jgi:hypothetical protein
VFELLTFLFVKRGVLSNEVSDEGGGKGESWCRCCCCCCVAVGEGMGGDGGRICCVFLFLLLKSSIKYLENLKAIR